MDGFVLLQIVLSVLCFGYARNLLIHCLRASDSHANSGSITGVTSAGCRPQLWEDQEHDVQLGNVDVLQAVQPARQPTTQLP